MPFRIANAATEADPDVFSGSRLVGRAPVPGLPAPEPANGNAEVRPEANVVDVAFEPVTVFAAPSASSLPVADTAETVIVTLLAERRALQGDYDHPHTDGGCAFCRRAVSAYQR